MSWSEAITVNNLRSIKGNDDNCYDSELQAYINSVVTDIEYLTGLDFDFPAGSQTVTFLNTKAKNQFVLSGSILQIGAWQNVTSVERSYISSSPSWSLLTEYDEYTLETPNIQGFNPITEIYFICSRINEYEQIRVTGTQGFSSEIPSDLLYVISEMVDAYYNRLSGGSGAYDVTAERSLTRSVQVQVNGLTSIQLFTPARITEFLRIIEKYNVKKYYPF